MICARCDKPIRDDEPYETYDVMRPTGAGPTLIVHARLCKRPPRQTPRPDWGADRPPAPACSGRCWEGQAVTASSTAAALPRPQPGSPSRLGPLHVGGGP